MALSRSSNSRLQRWALRAIAALLVVYMLGAFGVPTLIPYVTAIIAVVLDGMRSIVQARAATPDRPPRKDTIH